MARPEPHVSQWSPSPGAGLRPELRPTMLLAVGEQDTGQYVLPSFEQHFAHTSALAAHWLGTLSPDLLVVDLDSIDDAAMLCRLGSAMTSGMLVITASPDKVPAALKAGCHGVLLRPFTLNLLVARLGRLGRERAAQGRAGHPEEAGSLAGEIGTNHVWPHTACPRCQAMGPTSFEFSSHRRMWYACLACDAVWLGVRQEKVHHGSRRASLDHGSAYGGESASKPASVAVAGRTISDPAAQSTV